VAGSKKRTILLLLVVVALVIVGALVVLHEGTHPVKGDRSVQTVEKRQRSITDDPAVSGKVAGNGWRVTDGEKTTPDQLPPGEDEVAEFAELYKNTEAPKIVEEDLAPGATRTVGLQLTRPSALSGSARWIGTADALKVTIGLGASTLVTGKSYHVGTNRGGCYLGTSTSSGGHATLSVTNTSGGTVRVRILLMSTAL
jgi:hypothetical protein